MQSDDRKASINDVTTECATDLDYQSATIMFESILTTFEESIVIYRQLGQ